MPDRPSDAVAGIVLAAGASTRMGRNKLLLPLEGQSLLRRSVRTALDAGLDPVIVVLGHAADAALPELDGLSCQVVVNAAHATGMHSSVLSGLSSVPARAAAAVVLLADMPFVTSAMLGALVIRFRESGAPVVLSDYAGVQAPPTLYTRAVFADFGVDAGKAVVQRHRAEAEALSWPADRLDDLDAADDYERARLRL